MERKEKTIKTDGQNYFIDFLTNFAVMGQGTLTIYSASAGSGKTYKLTEIYLANLFRSRYNYRKILAVTFTNKARQK